MTDDQETPAADAAPPPADPATAGTERAFVRLTFWQTVLSLVGVFIAIVALYAALTESEATRKQTSAAVNLGLGVRMQATTLNFSIGIGLTSDAPDFSFGVNIPLRF